MNRYYIVLAVALWSMASCACQRNEAPAPEVSTSGRTAAPAAAATNAPTIRARIHPGLPEFSFALSGDSPPESGETLHIKKIEIRRGAETAPLQVIDGLETATPIAPNTPALTVVDMNFDGYGDIRLIEFQPAGPNVPYLNWLFDPAAGRFVASEALNNLPSPQFDPVNREIRSEWRASATSYGTDIYVFHNGELVHVRKESKEYKSPGLYTLRVSRLVNGVWQVVEDREVREP